MRGRQTFLPAAFEEHMIFLARLGVVGNKTRTLPVAKVLCMLSKVVHCGSRRLKLKFNIAPRQAPRSSRFHPLEGRFERIPLYPLFYDFPVQRLSLLISKRASYPSAVKLHNSERCNQLKTLDSIFKLHRRFVSSLPKYDISRFQGHASLLRL
jgi:hypothetical protein